jgi:activating signal cointegrator complex subunit 1
MLQRRAKLLFDARDVVVKYEDFEWMTDVRIEKIAICKMGAKKVVGDKGEVGEAYEVETEVDAP